ncbi:quinoprotein relay system zinc metallohydrolase 2 [Rhodovibrio sodomensis]|uniref:quinoprotein relay system zinc metallohydrolase 2 n=1 Tax=Rhodovibrio sodomensis TaxID=1088 RepID=UPI0030842BC1
MLGPQGADAATDAVWPPLTRRAAIATGAVAALSGLSWPAGAQAGPLPVSEVAPGHFVHYGAHQMTDAGNAGDIANCGFVVGRSGVAVIDSGGSPAVGRRLLQAVRRTTDRPIRYLINTHMHPDHVFGNVALRTAGDDGAVAIVGHARLEAALRARSDTYLGQLKARVGPTAAKRARFYQTDIAVEATRQLDLGDRTLELTAWPTAHTNNDLSVLDPTTGTFWAGDLVFRTRVPAVDGSVLGWLDVLERLRARPASTILPGHGRAASSWAAALDDQQRYLRALVSGVRAVLDDFGTIEQAVATAGRSEAGRWALFEQYHARNVTTAYAELEWN